MMDAIVLWLLTYVLHSTLLLGAVVLARLALGERRLAVQEAMLRAALLGGFVTASLQLALNVQPVGGSLPIPQARLEVAAPALSPQIAARDRATAPAARDEDAAATRELYATPSQSPSPARAAALPWTAEAQRAWRPALLILWGSLALIGAVRLALGARRLRQLLCHRQPLGDTPISARTRAIASVLGLRSPVRLSTAPRLAVPLATGVLRPEVCLPTRVLADLREEEQLALCAHELAHLARRDPAWLLIVRVAEALAPVQPLNRWARQRLSELAECLSDDLAVSASAQPLGLARSLVDVASWTLAVSDAVPATAAGAFGSRSRLAYRVERLMDPVRQLERPRRIFLALAGAATLATVFVVPVVSGSGSSKPAAKPLPSPAVVVPEPPPAPDPLVAPAPVVVPAPVVAPPPIVAPPPGQAPSPPPARPEPPVAGPAGREGAHAAEAAREPPLSPTPMTYRAEDPNIIPPASQCPPAVYPPGALQLHISGTVLLLLSIDETGKITDIRVLSGPEALRPAAIDYYRKCQFRPATTKAGRPVRVTKTVLIAYKSDATPQEP